MQRKKEARYHCLEADSIFLLLKINLTSDQAAKYEFILRLYLNFFKELTQSRWEITFPLHRNVYVGLQKHVALNFGTQTFSSLSSCFE